MGDEGNWRTIKGLESEALRSLPSVVRPLGRRMRICLIGDTHGFVPGLEAALAACRRHAPDLIVHCGDFLTSPFSPDPPGETIELLRAEGVEVIYGNNEAYFRDWGTPRWEATVSERRRRPDSPDSFLSLIEPGQAELSLSELAWLRALPAELSLDGARQGDVYVCHGMPGNPFATTWDTDPAFTPDFTAGEIDAALSRPAVASADLFLCGHTPGPTLLRTALPNGREALVVRSSGHLPGEGPGPWHQGICVLTDRGDPLSGFARWSIEFEWAPFEPRDPNWSGLATSPTI